jgi:hypothetical protein
MAAAFVDDVVSPELALVDPELAERARAALPLRGPTDRALAARAQQLSAVGAQPRRRRIVPVVALATMGLVSMLGPGLLRVGSTVGDSPSASASTTAIASGVGSIVAAPSSTDPSTTSARLTQGIAATDTTTPVADGVGQSQPMHQAALQASTGSNLEPHAYSVAPRVALRPTTLVWARVAGVSSYDFELVRNGSQIYAASSSSPNVDVPRSWTHRGMRFSIQPEDQAFVWPVIDGRRAAEPVVSGTLAFDHTLIARFTG